MTVTQTWILIAVATVLAITQCVSVIDTWIEGIDIHFVGVNEMVDE